MNQRFHFYPNLNRKSMELLPLLPFFSHGSLYLQFLRYVRYVMVLFFVTDTFLKLFFRKIRFQFFQISYSLAAEA